MPVFLTFDDGAVGGYDIVAVELERFGWRGHFFLTSDWIGRPGFMSNHQIRDLRARGHVIGSHTRSHPERMSRLGWKDLISEWLVSRSVLQEILGEEVVVASVSNGYYSTRVGQAAAQAGIQVLFNSEPRTSSRITHSCLVIGRYSIKARSKPSLSGRLAAGRAWPRWKQAIVWEGAKLAKGLTGESYLNIRRYLLSRMHSTAN